MIHKSQSSRSRLFPRRGHTEFFRDYDEFYVAADAYSLNIFHSTVAISTSKGIEVMNLDKKAGWSVPNLQTGTSPESRAHNNSIANRIKDLRPLGMFRISPEEFLVVFEECAVYVDKYGDVCRGVVMEFVGSAHSACLCGKFLILVNHDFVEVRNAVNGRMRQVIAGRNVTLLDDGGGNGNGGDTATTTAGSHHGFGTSSGFANQLRTVKICMQHPEHERSQIILELLENHGQKE